MKRKRQDRLTALGYVDLEALTYAAGEDAVLDQALIEADALGTAAHVVMLSCLPLKPPILTPAQANRVLRELASLVRAARAGRFSITLADQDVHLAVERALTERLGDLGRKIHTGRSRNDQVAVDLRLFTKVQLLQTLEALEAMGETLLRFARRHARVPMVGRTHMQPAMPSSVGLWASAHAESLFDDGAQLIAAYELNDQCPLGSAAGYGVPLPIDRHLVADLLGFRRPVHNVLYASNARGKVEYAVLSALGQVMLTLSRLAQDLVLFSLPEFGYFTLPPGFCTGSSIMPQKRNPDVLELVRARAASVLASAGLVAELVRAAPSGYNRDVQESKGPLMKGLATTLSTLRVLRRLLESVRVNAGTMRAAFTPEVFATDRALELVADGLPFRDAYYQVQAHLDELQQQDPNKAIARKTHWGAPAGLDFYELRRRRRRLAAFARKERTAFQNKIDRLLKPKGWGGYDAPGKHGHGRTTTG